MSKDEFVASILTRGNVSVNSRYICAEIDGVKYRVRNMFISTPLCHQKKIILGNVYHEAWDLLYREFKR